MTLDRGFESELPRALYLNLWVQEVRVRTNRRTQSSVELQSPPFDSSTVIHENPVLTNLRSIAVVNSTSNIQAFPWGTFSGSLLVLITGDPCHEKLSSLGASSRRESSHGLSPGHVLLWSVELSYFDVVGARRRVSAEPEDTAGWGSSRGGCSDVIVVILDDKTGGGGSTNPLRVLGHEFFEPFETVSLDDQGEKIGDSIVVVWLGDDNLSLPFGVQKVHVVGWDIGLSNFSPVIDETAKFP